MTPRTIIFVAARLLAVWCLVSSVTTLASAPAMDWGLEGEIRYAQLLAIASMTIMPLLCGALLWHGSAWLANRVSMDAVSSVPEPVTASGGVDSRWLFDVGVSLLGIVVIADVLPELANAVAFGVAAQFAPSTGEPIDTTLQFQRWLYQQAAIARIVSLVTRLAVGAVLLLGPRRVWREAIAWAHRVFRTSVPNDETQE
jgi:hypothetical protein